MEFEKMTQPDLFENQKDSKEGIQEITAETKESEELKCVFKKKTNGWIAKVDGYNETFHFYNGQWYTSYEYSRDELRSRPPGGLKISKMINAQFNNQINQEAA